MFGWAAMVSAPAHAQKADLQELFELIADGQLDKAAQLNRELVDKQPDNPELLFAEALIADKKGSSKKAIKLYTQLNASHPEMLEAFNNLAIHQANTGNYKAAIDTLERALHANPSVATAYGNLTAIYARLASAAYRKALNSKVKPKPLELASINKVKSIEFNIFAEQPALVASVENFINDSLKQQPETVTEPAPEIIVATVSKPIAPPSTAITEPAPAAIQAVQITEPVAVKPAITVAVVKKPSVAKATEKPKLPKPEIATDSQSPEVVTAVVSAKPTAAAKQAVEDSAAQKQALINQIKSWAVAWSDRDVDRYLSHYSNQFKPRNGLSLADWRQQRHGRLRWREFIIVKPSRYRIELNDDLATVNFQQYYKSDRFEDTIRKTLKLKKQRGKWLITEELI